MKMVTVGLVGCGRHLLGSLLPSIMGNKKTRIVAACDIDSQKLVEFKTRFPGIKTYNSFNKMIESNRDIDAVVISMDPLGHLKMSQEAINHNLHVFVEKPTGFSSEKPA